jgi:hypothetical protein
LTGAPVPVAKGMVMTDDVVMVLVEKRVTVIAPGFEVERVTVRVGVITEVTLAGVVASIWAWVKFNMGAVVSILAKAGSLLTERVTVGMVIMFVHVVVVVVWETLRVTVHHWGIVSEGLSIVSLRSERRNKKYIVLGVARDNTQNARKSSDRCDLHLFNLPGISSWQMQKALRQDIQKLCE